MRAPLPEIKQGIRLINESKTGSLKYGNISDKPIG